MGNSKSKTDTVETSDGRLCRLNVSADEVLAKQKLLVKKLHELADDLDKQQRKLRRAKIGLSASGLVGGVVTVAGFGLSFFTFGASLVLTSIGTGISLVTTVGSAATYVANRVIKRRKVQEANEAVKAYTRSVFDFAVILEYFCERLSSQRDRQTLRRILTDSNVMSASIGIIRVNSNDKLCSVCAKCHLVIAGARRIQSTLQGIEDAEEGEPVRRGLGIARWTAGAVSEASTFRKGGFRAFSSAARGIHIGDVAMTGVGIILDIGAIVYNSIKLHNKQPSEVAVLIRKLAQALDNGRMDSF